MIDDGRRAMGLDRGHGIMLALVRPREEPMSRRSLRVTAAVAVTSVTVLAGCTPTGGTAATYGDTSISDESVQTAVRDILKEEPQSGFDNLSAAIFQVLRGELSTLARKHGVYVAPDAAKAAWFKKTKNPSQAAVDTAVGSINFGRLRTSEKGQADLMKLFKTADVQLNPRYGKWVKGTGPAESTTDWIKTPAAMPSLSN